MPTDPAEKGIPFDYEIIDPTEKHFQMLMGNIDASQGRTMAIKSNDPLNWLVDGFVLTQDNVLYTINAVREDLGNSQKQSARYVRDIIGKEYVLRLVERENLLGLHI
jgi:hypothetical protein